MNSQSGMIAKPINRVDPGIFRYHTLVGRRREKVVASAAQVVALVEELRPEVIGAQGALSALSSA
jgi:hypothetical protein